MSSPKDIKKANDEIIKTSNEIRILREFVVEFNPFYDEVAVENFGYWELVDLVKDIVDEMF